MNREGLALLGALIGRLNLRDCMERGDCVGIAAIVNTWLPPDMKITAADVFDAIKDRPLFKRAIVNIEMLRGIIDKNPQLYSARISGSHQAIFNELRLCHDDLASITMIDVEQAMALRPVRKPEIVVSGSAALVGVAKM